MAPSQSTKMLIEAGIIPKNTLQQLVSWRLLPEDYAKSHGTRKVSLDTSNEEEVDEFVKDLGNAITKDMAEIRETDLTQSGGYQRVLLEFENSTLNGIYDVLVDKLGRLVVPAGSPWNRALWATCEDGVRKIVLKCEDRYSGDRLTAQVIYLEAQ